MLTPINPATYKDKLQSICKHCGIGIYKPKYSNSDWLHIIGSHYAGCGYTTCSYATNFNPKFSNFNLYAEPLDDTILKKEPPKNHHECTCATCGAKIQTSISITVETIPTGRKFKKLG